jgi:hypothetical protein
MHKTTLILLSILCLSSVNLVSAMAPELIPAKQTEFGFQHKGDTFLMTLPELEWQYNI